MKNYILMLPLLLALSSCAHAPDPFIVSAPVKPDFKPLATNGYIYGRFQHNSYEPSRNSLGNRIAVRIVDEINPASEPLLIAVGPQSDSVKAFEVKAGRYRISDYVFGNHRESKPIGHVALSKPFVVEAGKAYYIGDFFVNSNIYYKDHKYTVEWQVEDVQSRFRGSTIAISAAHTHLQSMPKINVFPDLISSNQKVLIEPLYKDEPIPAGQGVFFGEFKLSTLNVENPQKLQFSLLAVPEDGGPSYSIPFDLKKKIVTAPIPPGRYRLKNPDNVPAAPDVTSIHTTFEIKENAATYIGNHLISLVGRNIDGKEKISGGYAGSKNQFSDASKNLLIAYPQLVGVKIEDGR